MDLEEELKLERRWSHFAFLLGVWGKLLAGALEIFASLALFLTGGLSSLFLALARHELGEDPGDFIANKAIEYLPYLQAGGQMFAAWYFLMHSLSNIFVAVTLLLKKLWAFPVAISTHVLFVIYEMYRYSHTHSFFLILLAIFDILLIYFIWREYNYLKKDLNKLSTVN